MRIVLLLCCAFGICGVQLYNTQSHWPRGSHHDANVVAFHTNSEPVSRTGRHHHRQLLETKHNFYLNLLAQAEEVISTGKLSATKHLNHYGHKHKHSKHTHTNGHGHHKRTRITAQTKPVHSAKAMRFREKAFRMLAKNKQVPACIPYVVSVNACEGVSKAGENVLDTMINNKHKQEKKRAETEEDRLQKLLDKDIKERKYSGAALAMAQKAEAISLQERVANINLNHIEPLEMSQFDFSLNIRRVQETLQVYMKFMGANNNAVMPIGGGTKEDRAIA